MGCLLASEIFSIAETKTGMRSFGLDFLLVISITQNQLNYDVNRSRCLGSFEFKISTRLVVDNDRHI